MFLNHESGYWEPESEEEAAEYADYMIDAIAAQRTTEHTTFHPSAVIAPEETEAVLVDSEGKECDRWDPVYAVGETLTHWRIEGASHIYEEPKRPGYRLEVRRMEKRS